jgi:hypothetical protein
MVASNLSFLHDQKYWYPNPSAESSRAHLDIDEESRKKRKKREKATKSVKQSCFSSQRSSKKVE